MALKLRSRFPIFTDNKTLLDQADELDVEWTLVDIYDVNDGTTNDDNTGIKVNTYPVANRVYYDFKDNATRVTIGRNQTGFSVKNIFEGTIMVFRYRTIAYYEENGVIHRVTGPWSIESSNGSYVVNDLEPDKGNFALTDPSGTDAVDESNSYYRIEDRGFTYVEHLPLMNWQYLAVYAEEAKRKETITYFDGSLRNRQTVTTNNSEGTVLVQENVYDFSGRPAIQVLPVPVANGELKYYAGMNKNAAGTVYSANNFDKDISACAVATDSMSVFSAGAAKYYSASNTFMATDAYSKFVPMANGYPFMQTEFMPDNTGRPVATSGVGIKHRIDAAGKPTRYAYEVPFSKELNRLFGTEVGAANHYKKATVVDANGQPT
jgi:hypothetical protein